MVRLKPLIRWFPAFTLAGVLSLVPSPTAVASAPGSGTTPELVDCRKIWDAAPHNAFTDLTRFRREWFCVFREGEKHVSPDGTVRVLVSRDGSRWSTAARLRSSRGDLRDPKIIVTPQKGLMLIAAVALTEPASARHQTLAWFSRDGREWGQPVAIGEPDLWLWRGTWTGRTFYGLGYSTTGEDYVRLYRSPDGRRFETLVPRLQDQQSPNESSLVFQPDGTALCLLRRDGKPGTGLLGLAKPPYRDWEWKDLGVKIGGPHLLRLDQGRYLAAVRLYDDRVRTALAWVDPKSGRLTEALTLPSGGDTSYAGLVWHQRMLWVSYYSSHEGKTAIYLARVRLSPRK
jgi:hypothetical protein